MITRDRSVPITAIGGFLALKTPHAAKFQELLRERDVWTDYRAEVLRLGPAPYLSDRQLIDAVEALAETIEVVRSIV
jgi:kynureninase